MKEKNLSRFCTLGSQSEVIYLRMDKILKDCTVGCFNYVDYLGRGWIHRVG